MLKEILSISGRPGLYKLLSQGKNMLIVESLTDKKRFPVYMTEKVVALGDVAMYTDDVEVPLGEVMDNIYAKHNGAVDINVKKASGDELRAFMAEALPNYDRDRVYTNDIKKLISWYNLLVSAGFTEFKEPETAEPEQKEGQD
ncbi:MAG TPA: DUF5606 domain-containing protein [Candidatus Avibacteroides faecavium]|nr:DUF5606 domain-containing protein [Candidatus Avibacteroides faecavium]